MHSLFLSWVEIHGAGQCVEQPAEGEALRRSKNASYPVREYIGLVFASGRGRSALAAALSRFESSDISLDVAGLKRICNYFNNVDNSLDNAHVRFVHRATGRGRGPCRAGDRIISVEESDGAFGVM